MLAFPGMWRRPGIRGNVLKLLRRTDLSLSGTTQTMSIPSKHAECRHISKQKPSRALRGSVLELRRSILELRRLQLRSWRKGCSWDEGRGVERS
ncbi:hypothetical protein E2C01_082916 [Portunus trituberculatus]|uniref:Uncharacterized protein n=1 Tax=Portunus trituberculatus TaxID=210409 RepID=A0A5B7J340_PORTR|nr:hypothetical protein [Portunus trituberculatus]